MNSTVPAGGSFNVPAQAYNRFMGRFSEPLAAVFCDFAGVKSGTALDVGCGPGALTRELVERLGANQVSAVDPSQPFVAAARQRFPLCDIRIGVAEALPFPTNTVDQALTQLVVHFMANPVAGLREMCRVTKPGGTVAACVWDHAGVGGPLSLFWEAVQCLDRKASGEAQLAGSRQGDLARLFAEAEARKPEEASIRVDVAFQTFEDWWEPFTLGVGPAGAYVAALSDEGRTSLREECRRRLPAAPFTITAAAWAARGRV
ncbi:MAG TPA: class I SAM-dependent methyltransferase [Candidatus Lumbricidophila sp.]|nr:class I SAM-dependent methyltransferase [Candidatus Lumbricidophila sp.]